MMPLPDYWLKRPNLTLGEYERTAFDDLLNTTLQLGDCPEIQYTLSLPKWQFLCFVAEQHDIVLHGSGDANIARFEPRQALDLHDFGNQQAVYAASDGIWPMFFAIVDRTRFSMSVNNACFRLVNEQGGFDGPYYVFSISNWALKLEPWRTGTVYLLPRQTFMPQPPFRIQTSEVHIAQLASAEPVQPLAKLTVAPSDFPFWREIRGHDDARLEAYATAMQLGTPWPD